MGIRVKEHTMYRRHEWGRKLQQWMGGILILAIVLCASVAPGHARSGGGHRGGGHGFHRGHGGGGHGWRGHGFRGGHGWRGHGHHGKHSWGGVGVSIGVGSYWWPYWWPYRYPYVYPYTYSPQIYVQPSQPLSIQPPSSPPVWYYCDNPEGYYPYVQQCPGGWRTVTPSPQ
jgi:hypothetical protein